MVWLVCQCRFNEFAAFSCKKQQSIPLAQSVFWPTLLWRKTINSIFFHINSVFSDCHQTVIFCMVNEGYSCFESHSFKFQSTDSFLSDLIDCLYCIVTCCSFSRAVISRLSPQSFSWLVAIENSVYLFMYFTKIINFRCIILHHNNMQGCF